MGSMEARLARREMEETRMTIAFPAEWRLSRNEEAVLAHLALSDRPVPYAALDAMIAPSRRGPVGRPFKVLLHYLRRKLAPLGATIISRNGVGFSLTAESKSLIAAASAVEQAASRRMHELFASL